MTALQWGSPLTLADLESMPEDGHRYELIDGTLLVTPLHRIPAISAAWLAFWPRL